MTWLPSEMPPRRLVDLSHPVDESVQVYPGDPQPTFTPAATIERDGYNVLHLSMGSQTGTHVDAPYHFLADGRAIDELDLHLFIGPAVIIDCRGMAPRSPIGWKALEPSVDRLGPGRLVILHTGWSAHFRSDHYLDHPFLEGDAAERLVELGIRTVGIDAMSLDETGRSDGEASFVAHYAILGAGGVIVENLTNVAAVDFADPLVSVLPIRLAGADGAPVRAIAMDLPHGAS